MCDYSLQHVKSRPAKVGDKLTTINFRTGTRGFAAPEDSTTAVCILPGTELAFSEEVKCAPIRSRIRVGLCAGAEAFRVGRGQEYPDRLPLCRRQSNSVQDLRGRTGQLGAGCNSRKRRAGASLAHP
jgi:hypothetical protein